MERAFTRLSAPSVSEFEEAGVVADPIIYRTQNLYNNVSFMYPHANIWLTGHSVSSPIPHRLTRPDESHLAWGRPRISYRIILRRTCRGIRVTRRSPRCATSASAVTSRTSDGKDGHHSCIPQCGSNPDGRLHWCIQ